MVSTVYPVDQVDAGLRQKLGEDHPTALIVFHPEFKRWLLFERPQNSRWTAQALYEAMAEHHAQVQREGLYHGHTPKWSHDRGAPVMRDELPRRPGSWLLRWLNQNDLWRFPGGAKKWLEDIEAEEKRREEEPLKQMEDFHHDIAKESTFPLHAADALRGDPLAGKRKWRQTNPVQLKPEVPSNVPK